MSRLKYTRRLNSKEIKIVVNALLQARNRIIAEREFDKMSKFIDTFYTDDKLGIEKKIQYLEAKGYEVKRKTA